MKSSSRAAGGLILERDAAVTSENVSERHKHPEYEYGRGGGVSDFWNSEKKLFI